MDLEMNIKSEVKWDKDNDRVNLKKDTNELIYETERDSQTLKMNLWLPKGKG